MGKFQELLRAVEESFLHDFVSDTDISAFIAQSMVLDAKYKENHVLKILGRFMNARSALKYEISLIF